MALAEFALVNYISQCDDIFPPKAVHSGESPVKNNVIKITSTIFNNIVDLIKLGLSVGQ